MSSECSFEKKTFDMDMNEWIKNMIKGKTPFFEIQRKQEFLDFLQEFPVVEIKKGTILSVPFSTFDNNKKMYSDILWWNKFYPGGENGAIFKIGEENRDISTLYYECKNDFSVLYIPEIFKKYYEENNSEYIDPQDVQEREKRYILGMEVKNLRRLLLQINKEKNVNSEILTPFLDSFTHLLSFLPEYSNKISPDMEFNDFRILIEEILEKAKKILEKSEQDNKQKPLEFYVQGVKNWHTKGYERISNLGKKISQLGFNGYLIDDNCKCFISSDIFKRVLSRPFYIELSSSVVRPEIKELISRYNSGFYEPVEMKIKNTNDINKEQIEISNMLEQKNFSLLI